MRINVMLRWAMVAWWFGLIILIVGLGLSLYFYFLEKSCDSALTTQEAYSQSFGAVPSIEQQESGLSWEEVRSELLAVTEGDQHIADKHATATAGHSEESLREPHVDPSCEEFRVGYVLPFGVSAVLGLLCFSLAYILGGAFWKPPKQ